MLYLDNAATTLRKPLSVYLTLFKETVFKSYNAGRGTNKGSLYASETVVRTQEYLAKLLNVPNPQNIAFMPNATYALNSVILGTERGHIVVSQMEHNSVMRPVHGLGNYSIAAANSDGFVSAGSFRRKIKKDTKLVICTHASNVCGTIEPVEEISKLAHENGALFLLDASQSVGCIDVDNSKINADFIAFPGHKGLMAPLGTGGLYVKNIETLSPVITGGTGSLSDSMEMPHIMPDMLHPGTLNTPAIAAMGAAAEYILNNQGNIYRKERLAAEIFERTLKEELGDRVKIYGSGNKTGICTFNIKGFSSDEVQELTEDRISMRSGYHCAAEAHLALGTANGGAVRASFGAFDNTAVPRRAAKIIAERIWKQFDK